MQGGGEEGWPPPRPWLEARAEGERGGGGQPSSPPHYFS